MSQKEKLLKISSEICLKIIFTYIEYNHILKIIKNSKKIQGKLGINIQNYKKKSCYKYMERIITKRMDNYKSDRMDIFYKHCIAFLFTSIFFFFVLIYTAILFGKGGFDNNNTKSNYKVNYFNIIKNINISLFGFLVYIIASYFIIFIWATHNCYTDNDKTIFLKKCYLILTAIIYLLYEVCIIIKLYLSYKIKKNKTTWFMICDYFLIFLIPLYLAFIIYIIYYYFVFTGKGIIISRKKINILKQFQNIDIEDYELPYNFKEKKDKEKRIYIFNNKNNYKIKFLKNYIYLLKLINEFREKNNIDKLMLDETESFSNLIINKNSEIILFNYKTIYKFSKWEYLFVNPVNEFEKKIKNEDKDLIDILLIEDLDSIQINKQDNNEFIYIYKKIKSKKLKNYLDSFSFFRKQDSINSKRILREKGINYTYEDNYYGDST